MRSRQILTWTVILAVAAGAWFMSTYLDQRHQTEEDQAKRVLGLEDIMAVRAIELAGQDYPEPLRLERGGAGQQAWRLTRPLEWPADGMVVGRMLTSLSQARLSQRLETPGPLGDYGLQPPRLLLTLSGEQGPLGQLLVGEPSPTGESVYLARPGQPGVLLAPAQLRRALAKSLLELRDKVVLDFALDQVARVELGQAGGQVMVLERGEAGWRLAGQGPADPREVEDLLLQAHGLLAQDFRDQDFKPAKLGLEPPRHSLALTLKDGGRRGLAWGLGVPGKAQTYARRLEGGPLLLVQNDSLARLGRQPRDLLDRRLFTLERPTVNRLEIASPQTKIVFTSQEGRWLRLEPPDRTGGAGEAGELFLWDLVDLKWEERLPAGDYGLEPPALTLTLVSGSAQGQSQVLELGRRDPKSGLLAARHRGSPEIFGVKSDFTAKIPQEAGQQPPAPGIKATQ